MDAKDSCMTYISHCTVNNTIHKYSSASETKITATTTAAEETIDEIPPINSEDTQSESGYRRYRDKLATMPLAFHEVSSKLSFAKSYDLLSADFCQRTARSIVWQEGERISQMQTHVDYLWSIASVTLRPNTKQMLPVVDWRLLQGPTRCTMEKMEYYAKRDPLFVASLLWKSDGWNLDRMLLWLSEAVINVHKLCTQPMLLITISEEPFKRFKGRLSLKIDVSIIETGHTTRIPRYQPLHDPTVTRPRPRTILPPRSNLASTANPSSSNNQPLVPAPKRKSSPKFGPKPPPIPRLPNSRPGSSSNVSGIPRHKTTLSRPASLLSSSSKELKISQRLDELECFMKRYEIRLERVENKLG
ncbi:hypothetical protein BDN72DRAFT_850266 [Pluteus cervinus]|uniref:Uncharacterized protein n=1 Tax=Pluteus cervinus TaxID=181527 RepID=A0ACD3A4Z8_9AGAR|nr:hypothetical protein BDN72DRAFT_850266 [Pluteus cervinus]